eukprot:TRINITY_DN19380_c0_g1_i1.p1 TRINITY_DN19380_c0_g1~~TRINITY_DN19380_c0_g1_i1.p1  ORF type:complete len:301 (+),score=26.01 TRINITY_DN19380_c0_g1_i1:55-903(+)
MAIAARELLALSLNRCLPWAPCTARLMPANQKWFRQSPFCVVALTFVTSSAKVADGGGTLPLNSTVEIDQIPSQDAPASWDLKVLKALIEESRQKPLRPVRGSMRKPNAAGEWLCTSCDTMLLPSEFHCHMGRSRPPSSCKHCRAEGNKHWHRTLRGNVSRLVLSAKRRSRHKGLDFSLTHEDLLRMLWNQEGRCGYSGVGMEILMPNSHWRMSLERHDNILGYTPQNCILVAAEFNTSDRTVQYRKQGAIFEGSSQWSARKVQSVIQRHTNIDLDGLAGDI